MTVQGRWRFPITNQATCSEGDNLVAVPSSTAIGRRGVAAGSPTEEAFSRGEGDDGASRNRILDLVDRGLDGLLLLYM